MIKRFLAALVALIALAGMMLTGATPALATCSPTCFYYAGGSDVPAAGTTTGVLVAIDVKRPTLATTKGGRHTLAELDVQQSSTSVNNRVEIGWTVDPSLNGGSLDPYLFVFRDTNGTGGYNTAGGFQPCGPSNPACTTAPTIGAGQSLLGDVGTLKQFGLEYFSNAWWAEYNGQNIGLWPKSLWTSPTFTTVGMQQTFGEVVSTHDYAAGAGAAPCDQMGNGLESSNTSAMRMGSLTYIGTATATFSAFVGNDYPHYNQAYISPGVSTRSIRVGGVPPAGTTGC